MKLKIFTIFDQKAKAFITPFFLPEEGMAIRTFSDCVNDPEHQFGKHPQDYTLFNIGAWADNTAQIAMNDVPISLGTGIEYLNKEHSQPQLDLVEEIANEK